MELQYFKYDLQFKRPGGTSRGVLFSKETWYLQVREGNKVGYGECGLLRGLSADDRPDYEQMLRWLQTDGVKQPESVYAALREFPSIQMGWETAVRSLQSTNPMVMFSSRFTQGTAGIPINGLVWMGEKDFMKQQINEKLDQGFRCIKLKIGALNFADELEILRNLRREYDAQTLEVRVDANGAFDSSNALNKLDQLAGFKLHSIEQPIAKNQPDKMAVLCKTTPLPIALDEELISVFNLASQAELLDYIKPQYIVLKPSFVGGFTGTEQWIRLAQERNIGWWATSALESDIGLNAIAQWTATKNTDMPQGLGTGSLYTNNFESPLEVKQAALWFHPEACWQAPIALKEAFAF